MNELTPGEMVSREAKRIARQQTEDEIRMYVQSWFIDALRARLPINSKVFVDVLREPGDRAYQVRVNVIPRNPMAKRFGGAMVLPTEFMLYSNEQLFSFLAASCKHLERDFVDKGMVDETYKSANTFSHWSTENHPASCYLDEISYATQKAGAAMGAVAKQAHDLVQQLDYLDMVQERTALKSLEETFRRNQEGT